MDGRIVFHGDNKAALVIGQDAIGNPEVELRLAVEKYTRNWNDETNIGIKLINTQESSIYIRRVSKFTIGVQAIGESRGFTLNTVNIGALLDNKIALDLASNGNSVPGTEGYVNENLFINGKFRVNAGVETSSDRYGIRIVSKDGHYKDNNNNNFIKPSFELNAGTNQGVPVLIEHGNYNSFRSCRNESNSSTFAIVKNISKNNTFDLGYNDGSPIIQDESDERNSLLTRRDNAIVEKIVSPIFMSGPIRENLTHYVKATRNWYHFVGLNFSETSFDTYKTRSLTAPLSLGDDYVSIPGSRTVGVYVDTSVKKRFIIRRSYNSTNYGKMIFYTYDASNNPLTGTSPQYAHPGSSDVNYSNAYSINRPETEVSVIVHEDVKKLGIRFADVDLKSFSIISSDGGAPRVWPGYEEGFPGARLAEEAPELVSGSCPQGRITYHAFPQAGQPKGWMCTGSGWASIGNL